MIAFLAQITGDQKESRFLDLATQETRRLLTGIKSAKKFSEEGKKKMSSKKTTNPPLRSSDLLCGLLADGFFLDCLIDVFLKHTTVVEFDRRAKGELRFRISVHRSDVRDEIQRHIDGGL